MKWLTVILMLALIPAAFAFAEEPIAECDSMTHPTCWDSDGGIDEFFAGFVTGQTLIGDQWVNYTHYDHCLDEDTVQEFYCEEEGCGEYPAHIDIDCEFGCEDGACRDEEIPVFPGFAAAGLAVVGALAGFLFLRKKK